nr:hypothetical protein [FCB group bacterium]
ARMGSTRFPGKVLEDLAGKPMIGQLLDRLKNVRAVDKLILAISDELTDDPLAKYCLDNEIEYYRGSEDNVLQRYYEAAVLFELDIVIRVCGDSPLTDPEGISNLVDVYADNDTRFVHNRDPEGWPMGTAADLITTDALREALEKSSKPDHFEHIGTYLVENAEDFGMIVVKSPPELRRPKLDLSVDHPEDLEELRRIFRVFLRNGPAAIEIREIIQWLDVNPHKLWDRH